MKLSSSAFNQQNLIPARYTCDGENISPPLNWSEVPKNSKSLVLICDDSDAPYGTWDHWIIFNLPISITSLSAGVKNFPAETKLGKNGWGKNEYGGPCPPDKQHRYFFRLYALDDYLDLPVGSAKIQIKQAMNKHLIESAELIGLYARPRQKTN